MAKMPLVGSGSDNAKTVKLSKRFFYSSLILSLDNHSYLILTLLHSEWPKLGRVLAVLSAIGLKCMYMYTNVIMLIYKLIISTD